MKKITSILLAIQMIMGIFIAESYAADTGEIRIEAENYTETTAEMDIKEVKGDFSADKCLQKYYAKPTEDTYIISYSFNVPKIGRYELKGVGNVRQQANTTDWNVYINNEDNTPAEYAKLSDVTSKTYPSVLKEYSMGKFRIQKGENILYVEIDKNDVSAVAGNTLVVILDYFSLIPTEDAAFELESISFQNSKLGIFEEHQPVSLIFQFTAAATETQIYDFEVVDLWERNVLQGRFVLPVGSDSEQLDLGKFEIGWYQIKLYEQNASEPLDRYLAFSVVLPMSERSTFEDTSFATDFAVEYDGKSDRLVKDFANALKLSGLNYVRGRGSAAAVSSLPYAKQVLHESGISEISDHDIGAVLGTDTDNYLMISDLYEESYKVWKDIPIKNGNFAEALEVLNEVDLKLGGVKATADCFAAYFKAAAIGISDANPDLLKVFGGLALYDNFYIRQMMQNGMLDYSDVYNYHAHSEYKTRVEKARMIANAYSKDGAISVWGTEIGYPQALEQGKTSLTNSQMREGARAAITTAITSLAGGSNKNFWFLFRPYVENNQNFSCFSQEYLPYPMYSSISAMTTALGEGTIKGELSGLPSNTTGYLFDDGMGNDVAVVWSNSQNYISLIADEVTYMDMVGYEEVKYDQDGDGRIKIFISPDPIFVKFRGQSTIDNYYPMQYTQNNKPKTFSANERIVLQPIWECDDYDTERSTGYSIDSGEELEIKLRVYNLNDCAMSGVINVLSDDELIFEQTQVEFSLEAWGQTEIVFKVLADISAQAGASGDVKFYGAVSDGGEISRSVSKYIISNKGRQIQPEDICYFEDVYIEENWNLKNVAEGGKITMTGNKEENSAAFKVVYSNTKWEYPQFKNFNNSIFEDSSGIVFDRICEGTTGSTGVFVHMKDGRQYYSGEGNVVAFSTQWEQLIFPWSNFYLYSSPLGGVDTRQLDFEDIESISIGTSFVTPSVYKIKNFGCFYSDNQSDKISGSDAPEFSGMEEGEIYRQGQEGMILTARLPEDDIIDVRVLNGNDEFNDYEIKDGQVIMDFSKCGRGKYNIYVCAENKTNYQYVGVFNFYIE